MLGNTIAASAPTAITPDTIASPEQIIETITTELRRVLTEAENLTVGVQYIEIKCGFGMTLDNMRCHNVPIPW